MPDHIEPWEVASPYVHLIQFHKPFAEVRIVFTIGDAVILSRSHQLVFSVKLMGANLRQISRILSEVRVPFEKDVRVAAAETEF